jgi:hypothetical protein
MQQLFANFVTVSSLTRKGGNFDKMLLSNPKLHVNEQQ